MLVFGIVVGVFIALNALILIVFHAIYRKMFAHRADRTVPGVRDRAVEEFEGLKAEPFSFVSDGVMLRGFRYTGAEDNGKRIVFAHGIGAGGHLHAARLELQLVPIHREDGSPGLGAGQLHQIPRLDGAAGRREWRSPPWCGGTS